MKIVGTCVKKGGFSIFYGRLARALFGAIAKLIANATCVTSIAGFQMSGIPYFHDQEAGQ